MSNFQVSDIVEVKSLYVNSLSKWCTLKYLEQGQPYRIKENLYSSSSGIHCRVISKSTFFGSPSETILKISNHIFAIGDIVLFKPGRYQSFSYGVVDYYDSKTRKYIVSCRAKQYSFPARLLTLISES